MIGRRWPARTSEILKRAALQTRQAHVQQAISQLPRVEDRLLALFWILADRAGIFVPLTLAHETIAAMIGARRPTVSLGLGALSDQGRLVRRHGGWLLDPASRQTLQA